MNNYSQINLRNWFNPILIMHVQYKPGDNCKCVYTVKHQFMQFMHFTANYTHLKLSQRNNYSILSYYVMQHECTVCIYTCLLKNGSYSLHSDKSARNCANSQSSSQSAICTSVKLRLGVTSPLLIGSNSKVQL